MTYTTISGQRVEFEVEDGIFCEHNQWAHDCRACGTRTYGPHQHEIQPALTIDTKCVYCDTFTIYYCEHCRASMCGQCVLGTTCPNCNPAAFEGNTMYIEAWDDPTHTTPEAREHAECEPLAHTLDCDCEACEPIDPTIGYCPTCGEITNRHETAYAYHVDDRCLEIPFLSPARRERMTSAITKAPPAPPSSPRSCCQPTPPRNSSRITRVPASSSTAQIVA